MRNQGGEEKRENRGKNQGKKTEPGEEEKRQNWGGKRENRGGKELEKLGNWTRKPEAKKKSKKHRGAEKMKPRKRRKNTQSKNRDKRTHKTQKTNDRHHRLLDPPCKSETRKKGGRKGDQRKQDQCF